MEMVHSYLQLFEPVAAASQGLKMLQLAMTRALALTINTTTTNNCNRNCDLTVLDRALLVPLTLLHSPDPDPDPITYYVPVMGVVSALRSTSIVWRPARGWVTRDTGLGLGLG